MITLLVKSGSDLQMRDWPGDTTIRAALGRYRPLGTDIEGIKASGDARIHVGDQVQLSPVTLMVWLQPPLINANRPSLELFIDLHPHFANLQTEGGLYLRIAASKRLDLVVLKLIESGVRPDYLLDALVGSGSYKILSDGGSCRALIGFHIRADASEWQWVSDLVISQSVDDSWMCALVTPQILLTVALSWRDIVSYETFPQLVPGYNLVGAKLGVLASFGPPSTFGEACT